MKKLLTYISLLMLVFLPNTVFAIEENNEIRDLDALKEAIKNENKVGEYDINISVPGNEYITSGANVLFLMDASYSTDEEWQKMRKSVIDTATSLLSDTKNVNKVGLMTFGVASHLNIPLTSDINDFERVLPQDKGGSLLLPGRSATNIEGGLRGATEYLSSLGELAKDNKHTYVIFLTDGEANFNETKFNWYQICLENTNYLNNHRNYILDLLSYADDVRELDRVSFVNDMIKYVKTEYVNELNKNLETDIVITDEYLDTLKITTISSELSKEKLNGMLDKCIEMLYTGIGYDINNSEGYSISELENMFAPVEYIDDANYKFNFDTYVFYSMLTYAKEYSLRNVTRSIEQGKLLNEYATVYTIGYNIWRPDALKIMNPNYEGGTRWNIYFTPNQLENHFSSKFYDANKDTVNGILDNIASQIIYTGYKNPVIVDYTSKWVNPMDINNDGIFDEKDIIVTNDGEVVDDAIVKVEKLSKQEIINSTDPEVKGNSNGDIYKITWSIDGYLRSWDKFKLNYKVKVDTQEKDFVSGYEYKANGITTLTYDIIEFSNVWDNGELTTVEKIIEEDVVTNIEVPVVSQIENVVVITKTDENGELLEGADFDITSNDGVNQIIKEYSIDGVNWTTTNEFGKATYFRFSGLYDFEYVISETKTPDGYFTIGDITYNFDNIEDKMVSETVVNRRKDLVPKTYNGVNYKKGINMSLLCLAGMSVTGLNVKKKKGKKK